MEGPGPALALTVMSDCDVAEGPGPLTGIGIGFDLVEGHGSLLSLWL